MTAAANRIRRFYDKVLRGGQLDELPHLVAAGYTPHVPAFADKSALQGGSGGLSARLRASGPIEHELVRTVTEGDVVFAHVHYTQPAPTAGIDVFRIDTSGLIAEHWNVRQPVGGMASVHGERFAASLVADDDFPHPPQWSRARVARMLQDMWGHGRRDLVPEFYARSYIQHNPELPGGYERILRMVGEVRQYVERTGGPFPISVHHMVAEKDLVCVHLSIFMAGLDRSDGARSTNTDIFRLDRDGRMVEHWDVLQIDGIAIAGGSLF